MTINKNSLAFTVPVKENGKNYTVYIPAPSKVRSDFAIPVLGKLFSMKEDSKLHSAVLARDYEVYARRACKQLAKENNINERDIEAEEKELFDNFKNFIEASMLVATVVLPDFSTVKLSKCKLEESTLEYITGLYTFFFTTLRYASMLLSEKDKKAFTTSLNITDFINLLQTLLSEKDPSALKEIP